MTELLRDIIFIVESISCFGEVREEGGREGGGEEGGRGGGGEGGIK